MSSPVERVLTHLHRVSGPEEGPWKALCPSHQDSSPSLSIGLGEDGRVLLKCFAGCTSEEVVASLGLKMYDLFADRSSHSHNPSTRPHSAHTIRATSPPPKTYESIHAAQEAIQYGLEGGPAGWRGTGTWGYEDVDGRHLFHVLRYDKEGAKKQIRPLHFLDGQWRIGKGKEPWPIYNISKVLEADEVLVVEGEKCTDVAASLGFVATTSASGAGSVSKVNWSVLAGKRVCIWPDKDEAGERYATAVAAEILQANPNADIRIIQDPCAPEVKGYDIADYVQREVELRRTSAELAGEIRDWIAATPAEVRQCAGDTTPLAAISGASVTGSSAPAAPAEELENEAALEDILWEPFPIEVLPPTLRDFCKQGAAAVQCDTSFFAVPALAAASSAIGTTRRLRLHPTWAEFPTLWGVIVGESGTCKTPALTIVLKPYKDRHAAQNDQNEKALADYERDLAEYQEAKVDCRGERPMPPSGKRCIVRDITREALARTLQHNPRGVLLHNDELAGWFDNFKAYGATGVEAFFLSTYAAEDVTVDRVADKGIGLHIPQASVSIVGSIQPSILRRCLGEKRIESGLAARLMIAFPPRHPPKIWPPALVATSTLEDYAAVVGHLFALEPAVNLDGSSSPLECKLSGKADRVWGTFVTENARQTGLEEGAIAAAYSKIEGRCARYALILHHWSQAEGEACGGSEFLVSEKIMCAAVRIAEWEKRQTLRLYGVLAESVQASKCRQLLEVILRLGGAATTRELSRDGGRKYRDTAATKVLLGGLLKDGKLVRAHIGQGNRTKIYYVVSEVQDAVIPKLKAKGIEEAAQAAPPGDTVTQALRGTSNGVSVISKPLSSAPSAHNLGAPADTNFCAPPQSAYRGHFDRSVTYRFTAAPTTFGGLQ